MGYSEPLSDTLDRPSEQDTLQRMLGICGIPDAGPRQIAKLYHWNLFSTP